MGRGHIEATCNDVRRPAARHAACANVELRVPTQVPAAFLPLLLHINEFLPLVQSNYLAIDHSPIREAYERVCE